MLTSVEADKAVRVARVTARAQQVFAGLPAYAAARIRLIRDCVRKRDYFNPICHVRADEHLRLRTIGLAIGRISPANQTAT